MVVVVVDVIVVRLVVDVLVVLEAELAASGRATIKKRDAKT